jgi:hypothetical protein
MGSLDKISKEEQIRILSNNGYIIMGIKNPSLDLCLVAVRETAYAIEYIKNPSEEIQIEAVKNFNYDVYNDNFVKKHITSNKAKELYEKLKMVKGIIK